MARIASTTSAGVDLGPTGGLTLDALMARAKAQAELQQQAMAPRVIQSPWQGAAQMAQSFLAGHRERQAEQELAQGRAALAQIMSGVDPMTGANSQQLGQAYQLDPDLGLKLMDQAIQARREQQQLTMHNTERAQDRDWQLSDAQAQRDFATAQQANNQNFTRSQTEAAQRMPKSPVGDIEQDFKNGVYGDPATPQAQKLRDDAIAKANAPPASTVINTGDMSNKLTAKFDEKEGETWSGYLDQGAKAASTLQDMQLLDELAKVAPQGPLPGALQKMFPGISNAGAAFQSIVKRVAPTMRAVGSGSTSDIEYNGMLQSLPALGNYPEANQLISGMMKAKAQMDLKRADIVTQWRNRTINDAEARNQLGALNRQSIMSPELRQLIDRVTPQEGGGVGGAGGWKVEEVPD